MVLGRLDRYNKKLKLDQQLTPYTRIDPKCIRVKYKSRTIKILGENIGSKILDISLSSISSDMLPGARETKEKTNRWNYIKLQSFCTAKGIFDKIKEQPTEWRNIYSDTSDKGLISKIYKVLAKLNTKNTKSPI